MTAASPMLRTLLAASLLGSARGTEPACQGSGAATDEACEAELGEAQAWSMLQRNRAAGKVELPTEDTAREKPPGISLQSAAAAASREARGSAREGHAAAAGSGDWSALDYCDSEQLLLMHGRQAHNDSHQRLVEEDIMRLLTDEMSSNNVDQAAREIFSFYVCVRWVPDEIFWRVAEQELAGSLLQTIVEGEESLEHAIAEIYQNFKFVPLLCSRNLEVYGDRSNETLTYFRNFEERVGNLSAFLNSTDGRPVWEGLKHADYSFCNSRQMNSRECDAQLQVNEWMNQVSGWFGDWTRTDFDETQDRWMVMRDIFRRFAFRGEGEEEWDADFAGWKAMFPYHSFVGKPDGAHPNHSPLDYQRFMVCYGKRVASDLHRRPVGTHIITDQNSVGCHGWWGLEEVATMLDRMVALWRPPTCKLSEMSFVMKRRMLRMYQEMGEDLFEALPSMMHDEQLDSEGSLDLVVPGPPRYNVTSLTVDGKTFHDGVRVASLLPRSWSRQSCGLFQTCTTEIPRGGGGQVRVTSGTLEVKWDGDPEHLFVEANASTVQVVPAEYDRQTPGVIDEFVDTVGSWGDNILDGFRSLWGDRQTNLAGMLSGSTTKWVVCGVAANASYDELDALLGTEDEAFMEHVREAYSQWTGYERSVPGETCEPASALDGFPEGCQVCDYSELHTDHPEEYFNPDGSKEEFVCPLVPPMEAVDQLGVFREKTNMCLLRMTANQKRQAQWYYQGHHPARRQNKKETNVPRDYYELVRLLDVNNQPGPRQVSFARTCTPEAWETTPRFCEGPKVEQPWPSLDDMARSIGAALQGAVGMPVGAIWTMVDAYRRMERDNMSGGDAIEMVGTMMGEGAWQALMGAGRFLHSTVRSGTNNLRYPMEGEDIRHARLEREMFSYSHSGDLLHGISYQHEMGTSNTTSNSRERYQRYAVVCPCSDFDPAMEFANRWEWSEVALRALREAVRHAGSFLERPNPVVELRAEARVFFRQNQEAANTTFHKYGAAVRPLGGSLAPLPEQPDLADDNECNMEWGWWGRQCIPEDRCEITGTLFNRYCVMRDSGSPQPPRASSEWRTVWDATLAGAVGGQPIGQVNFTAMKALTVHYFCGAKRDFPRNGMPPAPTVPLEHCAREGAKNNARLRAAEPWRLYFPDEVVVLAVFGTLEDRYCLSTDQATEAAVCAGATAQEGLDNHVDDILKQDASGEYRGLRTGSDFPAGAVNEVVLWPEDVLETNGRLLP